MCKKAKDIIKNDLPRKYWVYVEYDWDWVDSVRVVMRDVCEKEFTRKDLQEAMIDYFEKQILKGK